MTPPRQTAQLRRRLESFVQEQSKERDFYEVERMGYVEKIKQLVGGGRATRDAP